MNRWLMIGTVTYVLLLLPWAAVAMGTMMSVSILEHGTPLTKVWFRGVLGLVVSYPISVVFGVPLAWWAHKTAHSGVARASLIFPLIVIGVFILWVIFGLFTN